ncbi:hypothetical protein R1flu_018031 [Riccia fluitans]|uniref:Uncharacterized protein n=1 Tax=Riccia fluitans TaxID=41844 RepID=A0ABD1ZEP8_9MARC
MKNRNGAGTNGARISSTGMVQLASHWCEQQRKTLTTEDSSSLDVDIDGTLSLVGIGGKGALNLKKATAAAEQRPLGGDHQVQFMLGKKVIVQPQASKACKYRATLRVQMDALVDWMSRQWPSSERFEVQEKKLMK